MGQEGDRQVGGSHAAHGCQEKEGQEEEEEEEKEEEEGRRFPGGKRRKGQHKSKAAVAAGKKKAAAMKKAGKGIFKPVTLSSALAKVTGISGKATRGAVTKAVWAYIKKKGLNK